MPRFSEGPRPAASVAFVRDADDGLEIYLSRRPMHFRYFPGAFVFPGGRAEESDRNLKETACREVLEEIGVEISPDDLVLLRETHTSAYAGPVYHLFIFACVAGRDMVTSPNPDEIDDEVWVAPDEALRNFDLPYQIMCAVKTISGFRSTGELLTRLRRGSINEDFWY